MKTTINVSLKYTLGEGAAYNGLPMLVLSKGDTPVTDVNLLNAIRTAESTFKLKGKILCLTIKEELDPEEQVILSNVLFALSDWIKIIKIYQPCMTPLMKDCEYLIAVVKDPFWARFKANEVWYEPSDIPTAELDLGPVNTSCGKFILPTKIKVQDAFNYIREAQNFYGILRETKKPVEVEIL